MLKIKLKKSHDDLIVWGIAVYLILYSFWTVLPRIPFIGIGISGVFKFFLLACAIFVFLFGRKKFNFNLKHDLAIAGLFLISIISLIIANNFDAAFSGVITFVNIFLLYLLMTRFIREKKHFENILTAFFVSAALHSLFIFLFCYSGVGLKRWYSGENILIARPALILDPNSLAAFLVSSIPVGFYLTNVEKQRYKKIFFSAMIILASLAVLLTFSRSGMISLFFVLLMLLIKNMPRKASDFANNPYLCLILLLFVLLPVFVLSDALHDGNIICGDCKRADFFGGTEERLMILDSGLAMAKGNFFTGVGIDNFEYFLGYYNDEHEGKGFNVNERSPHNTYLSFFSSFGFFGFIIFLIIISLALYSFYKSKSPFSYYLLASFIGLLIVCFFLDLKTEFFFWFFIILSAALEKNYSEYA